MEMHNPPHPGEVLKGLYVEPLGLKINEIAERLGVERKAISRILNGRAGISAEMAIRLSRAFNTTPDVWMNMQRGYDLWQANQHMKKEAARIRPFLSADFGLGAPA